MAHLSGPALLQLPCEQGTYRLNFRGNHGKERQDYLLEDMGLTVAAVKFESRSVGLGYQPVLKSGAEPGKCVSG